MAVHPRDRINIDPESVIHDRDGFHEPFFVVERTMGDPQMEDIGQIHAGNKPARHKVDSADQQSSPWSQVSWGGNHARHQVDENNQIAGEVIDLHDDSTWLVPPETGAAAESRTKNGKVYRQRRVKRQSILSASADSAHEGTVNRTKRDSVRARYLDAIGTSGAISTLVPPTLPVEAIP